MNPTFIILIFFILFFVRLKSQNNHPYQNGEKIINEKIEMYRNIDTLNYYSPVIAMPENRIPDYKVFRNEGEIKIENKEKNLFGSGGLNIYAL